MQNQRDVYQDYVAGIKQVLDRLPWQDIYRVEHILLHAWQKNQQVFIMGNGGSAATASHMACDLAKNTASQGTPRLRALSINDNLAHFSALANDVGYENVFAEQLRNFVNTDDVVLAISTSGNSPNVIQAVTVAREYGAFTIGWCGYQGGQLAKVVDLPLVVPSESVEQIEDIHLMLEHMITVAVRRGIREHTVQEDIPQPVHDSLTVNQNGKHDE